MLSFSGILVVCAAIGGCSGIIIKKDFLKTKMDCGAMSAFKTTLFESPTGISNQCVYTFARHSPDVTQLRIELQEFRLMQPQVLEHQPDQRNCINKMTVNDMTICGINDGQHIYVPFDSDHIRLVFNTPVADSGTRWKMNVTQLEDPTGKTRPRARFFMNLFGNDNSGDNKPQNPLEAAFQNVRDTLFPNKNTSNLNALAPAFENSEFESEPMSLDMRTWNERKTNDALALAPVGCTQYFTDRTGTVKSFNFNGGAGPYMSNQSYSICFKRFRDSTGVELTFEKFAMPNEGPNMGTDLDCHSSIPTMGRQEDYLAIPGAVTKVDEAVLRPTYFCGRSTSGRTVTFGSLGPFVMYFHSDSLVSDEDKGFKFNYRII